MMIDGIIAYYPTCAVQRQLLLIRTLHIRQCKLHQAFGTSRLAMISNKGKFIDRIIFIIGKPQVFKTKLILKMIYKT
ncbi:hypothetical protein D3C72_1339720 [compost metagenome]